MAPSTDMSVLTLAGLDEAPAIVESILRVLPDSGIIVVDRGLRLRIMRGPVFARHGYDSDTVVGRELADVIPAEAWGRIRGYWLDALHGEAQSVDWRSTTGIEQDYWTRFVPIVAPDGPVVGAMMVAQDISDRAHARRELERRVDQQAAVSALGKAALRGGTVQDIVDLAAELLLQALGADFSALMEDVPGEALRVRAARGEALPPPLPAPRSGRPQVFEHIRATDSALLIADLPVHELEAPVLEAAGMRSLVAAPIASSAGRFGLLGAASRVRDAFSHDDLAFLQTIANVVADAVDRDRAARQVAEAERRLADFWELSGELLAVFSPDGRFVEVSGAWERVLGWTQADLAGRSGLEIIMPEDRAMTVARSDPAMHEDRALPELVNRIRAKDGSYRTVLWNVREAPDGYLYTVAKDITERRRDEEELARRESLLHQAERLARAGSWEVDLATARYTVSPHLQTMMLLPSPDPHEDEMFDRVHPDDRAALRAALAAQAAGTDQQPADFRVVLADGAERIYSVQIEQIRGEGRLPTGLRGIAQDVTEQREAARRLEFSEERFRQGFDHAPIAMSLVDAQTSGYLRVNDAYCAMVGRTREELLAGMTFRDVLHPEDVERATDRLMRAGKAESLVLEKRYLRPDGSIVWGSIHVAPVLGPEGELDVLFAQTIDVTERHTQEDALRRQLQEVAWIGEIRAALAEDRFELHAQPIVDLATGETVHHELLLRMRDPDGQLVSPDAFLPTAERYGDIRDIDRWVISHAMELAARGMSVGINVSGTSLGDPGLIDHIDAELERTGAPPERLVFEITETALVESAETARILGTSLRERGCRFALDDFGTGYGGFHYLKTLPLDFLKIDREFVRDALTSESDRHLIWAVVSLAKGFGLRTIAEGIENAATLDLLREMGVDEGQGYHLGRPGPIPEEPRS
ncbi:MAG: hypothetical protein JWM73_1329 [Solirubrobacterales bacterium]|nr:hypothetical protein [Solirubrobacterales bacterium]